ncbi:hypothetical protein Dimus_036971, partial [Dionaea muscipula]
SRGEGEGGEGEGGDKSAKRQQSSGGWLSPSTSDDSLVSLGNDREHWGNEFCANQSR